MSYQGLKNQANGIAGLNSTGQVPIAQGGTGASTTAGALNALLPSQTGNSGKVLSTDGTNTSWQAVSTGTVTSVSVTTANGISGTVATATTTPAISLTIGSGAISGSQIVSSVALAGSPTTTTQTQADNSTKIATTAYVDTGLGTKQAIISSPTANDFVSVNSSGQVLDSGISLSTTSTTNSNTQILSSAATQSAINSKIANALIIQGTWNASTNTPTLTAGTGTTGYAYYVSVAGTQSAPSGTATVYNVGDLVLYANNIWDRLESTQAVNSVFGRTGTITANTGDYTISQVTNGLSNSLISTNVFVGNGSGIATGVAISGDASLANTGALTVATATNLRGGGANQLPYQSASGTTAFLNPVNSAMLVTSSSGGIGYTSTMTNGQIVVGVNSGLPQAVTVSGDALLANNGALTVSNSTNLKAGVAGAIPYQSAVGTTGFTAAGTTGQVLTSAGTGTPTWTNASTGTVSSVSVVTANGLSGTVATATTTPAITLTLGANAVANSQLAQAPANTMKGNNTGSTANEADLTVAQVTTLISSTTPTASKIPQWDTNKNLSSNNVLTALTPLTTATGNTTLSVTSTYQQYFTGSSPQTVTLPVATTLVNGQAFLITNASTGVITVQTSGSNAIQAMAANTQLIVTCANTAGGTGTASWAWVYSPLKGSSLTGFSAYSPTSLTTGQVVAISSTGLSAITGTGQAITSFNSSTTVANSYTTATASLGSTSTGSYYILTITTIAGSNSYGYQAYSPGLSSFTPVSSGTSSISAASSINAEFVCNSQIYGSTGNTYAVFALQDQYLQAVNVSISGSVMTIGAVTTVTSSNSFQRIVEVGTDKFLYLTSNLANPGSIYGQVFTVNPSTMAITLVGSNVVVFSNVVQGTYTNFCVAPTGNSGTQPGGFCVAYINTSGNYALQSGQVTGTSTITAGSTYTSSIPISVTNGLQMYFIDIQTVVLTYITSGTAYAQTFWINGGAAQPGTQGSATQIGAASSYASVLALATYSPQNLLVILVPTSSNTTLTAFVINTTDSGVTSVTAGVNLTTTTGSNGLNTCKVFPSQITTSLNVAFPIVSWITNTSPPNLMLNTANVSAFINYVGAIGIADQTGSGTIPVSLLNQVDTAAFTGLTVGAIYYIQPSGYLGTTVTSYPFGRAISSTQMNLTRNP